MFWHMKIIAKLYPGYNLAYKNHSQTIPQYSLATIFICQNISPVWFSYNFRTPNHTEVESVFVYILAVTDRYRLVKTGLAKIPHQPDV